MNECFELGWGSKLEGRKWKGKEEGRRGKEGKDELMYSRFLACSLIVAEEKEENENERRPRLSTLSPSLFLRGKEKNPFFVQSKGLLLTETDSGPRSALAHLHWTVHSTVLCNKQNTRNYLSSLFLLPSTIGRIGKSPRVGRLGRRAVLGVIALSSYARPVDKTT